MRAAQLSRCAALLLLLGAALATVPGRPTVTDIISGLHKPASSAKASVASASQNANPQSYGYDSGHVEEKEVGEASLDGQT